MRINDPKSLIFIDGIKNLSGNNENFASITFVSNAISDSWQINQGKYDYEAGQGISIHYDQNGHEISDAHHKAISIKISQGEKYLEVLPWSDRNIDDGLHTKGIDEAISAATNDVITGRVIPIENKLSGITTVTGAITASWNSHVNDYTQTAGPGIKITNNVNSFNEYWAGEHANVENNIIAVNILPNDSYLTISGISSEGLTEFYLASKGINEAILLAKNQVLTGRVVPIENKLSGITSVKDAIAASWNSHVNDYTYANGDGIIINDEGDTTKTISIKLSIADPFLKINENTSYLESKGINEAITGQTQPLSNKINFISGILSGYNNTKAVSSVISGLSKRIDDIIADSISVSGINGIAINPVGNKQVISAQINPNDNILIANEDGLIADIKLSGIPTNQGYASSYALIGKNGTQLGVPINIPKDQFLSAVQYIPSASSIDKQAAGTYGEGPSYYINEGDPCIKFTFNLTNGDTNTIYVNVKDLVDVYTGASGITINPSTNIISLNKAGNEIGGVKTAGDVSISNGTITVNQATKVKKPLKFEIAGEESNSYYSFDGSTSAIIGAGSGIKFEFSDNNLLINSIVTASSLGALTGIVQGTGISISGSGTSRTVELAAAGSTLGGVKTAGDVSISNGTITVLSANQVKHDLSFVIHGESDTYYTFNGSNNKNIVPGNGIQFIEESGDLIINSDITASNLGAITTISNGTGISVSGSGTSRTVSLKTATSGEIGGVKSSGDISVNASGAVTVLSANQVKHGLKFYQTATQEVDFINYAFNGLSEKTIQPGNGIYFKPIGAGEEGLYDGIEIKADVTNSTLTNAISNAIAGTIAIQPIQFSTAQMTPSASYQRTVVFEDGGTELVNFQKRYYDISGYVFELTALDKNETMITEMQHLDNGDTRIWMDFPWNTSGVVLSGKPIIKWELQNNQRVAVTENKLSFKAAAFVKQNGQKITLKTLINKDV